MEFENSTSSLGDAPPPSVHDSNENQEEDEDRKAKDPDVASVDGGIIVVLGDFRATFSNAQRGMHLDCLLRFVLKAAKRSRSL